jgi:hypothetical protein
MNQLLDQAFTYGGPDGLEILNDLAKDFGAPIKRAKVMLEGDITLTRRLRAPYRGHQIELLANRDLVLADVEAPYGQFRLFYINPRVLQSRYGAPACTLNVSGFKHQVFNYHGELSPAQADLVDSGALERLLGVIDPQEGEEINVSQRLVRVYLRRPTKRRVMAVVHAVMDLMPHESDWKEASAFEEVPAALRPLIPLVERWAISDDEERWRKLNHCAPSTRQKLVGAVVPLIPVINQFLDTFGNSPSEEACAFGDLAQAALEAQSLLAERPGKPSK